MYGMKSMMKREVEAVVCGTKTLYPLDVMFSVTFMYKAYFIQKKPKASIPS